MTGPLIISAKPSTGGPLGREKTVLDLARLHFDHVTYGVRVMGTWLRIDPKGPCLVLAPVGVDLQGITPCIVPMATCWVWDEQLGDKIRAECMAAEFILSMGGSPFDRSTRHRVMAAVRARLPDLLAMPPEPAPDQILAGHLIARDSEGVTRQIEVNDDA